MEKGKYQCDEFVLLIVYDSLYGNTERLARCIAYTLSEFGQARAVRVGHIHPDELQNVDLLILGCPPNTGHETNPCYAGLYCEHPTRHIE